jgi:hypothetical protein
MKMDLSESGHEDACRAAAERRDNPGHTRRRPAATDLAPVLVPESRITWDGRCSPADNPHSSFSTNSITATGLVSTNRSGLCITG